MMNDQKAVSRALASRENLFEIIIIAIILAFGINLLTGYIGEVLGAGSFSILISACALIVAPFVYLFARLKKSLRTSTKINAAFAFDIRQCEIAEIPSYSFSDRLRRTLRAAFVENEAYARIWRTNPLATTSASAPPLNSRRETDSPSTIVYSAIYSEEPHSPSHTAATKLLVEAVEYQVIELISDHLSSYFDGENSARNEIYEVTGSHIPEILLSNRFLKLLTTPLEERTIYTQAEIPLEGPTGGTLKYIYGSDGSIYTTLSLWLPKGTLVTRPDHQGGTLHFKSKRAEITIKINFNQERSLPPTHFVEMFLGKTPSNIAFMRLAIDLEVKVPITSLLSVKGWKLYQWADSLPERFKIGFDFDDFINRINWDQARAQARVNKILKRIDDNIQRRNQQTAQ